MSDHPPPGSPPRPPFGLRLKIQQSPGSPEKSQPNPGFDLLEEYRLEPLADVHTNTSGLRKAGVYYIKRPDGSTEGIRKYLHFSNRRARNTYMIPEIQNYRYISSHPGYHNYVLPILRTSEPTLEMTDFYIDFPYINGVDLFKYLTEIYDAKKSSGTDMKDEYTQRLLSSIFADVAKSIIFLHSIGVRHNDIKLDNIFVVLRQDSSFIKAVLFDFDVSEIISTHSPAIVGADYKDYIQLFEDNLTLYCGIPLPAGVPKEVANIEQEKAVLNDIIVYLRGGAAVANMEGGKRHYSKSKKTRTRPYPKTLKVAPRKP